MFCFLTIEPQLTEAITRTGDHNDRVRQTLNSHTGSFYLPEFLSEIQTTASSLSVRHDPGGHGVCTVHACYPRYAAKNSAFETSTQITRDFGMPVGY